MGDSPLRAMPRMDDLLHAAAGLRQRFGDTDVHRALDRAAQTVRDHLLGGEPHTADATTPSREQLTQQILDAAAHDLGVTRRRGPRRVVNAAGVIVHTNLGRAPLPPSAVEAVVQAAGYCDLEMDLAGGVRGSRGAHVDALLAAATGAEDAMVVNNCAAALVLALATLAGGGRAVTVSRGHLIEIGGSFRLPDIMASSGARLVEVGTTNRTRAADHDVDDDLAAILTVHWSNFTQQGFVQQADLSSLAEVAARRGVPLIHDAGSGLLVAAQDGPLSDEPSMATAITQGADLVLASGDKLLGGAQAGLIAGRRDLVQRLRTAPLARALRVDKLRLAALNSVLRDHLAGRGSTVGGMVAGPDGLAERTTAMADRLDARVVQVRTMIGGGSAPGVGVDGPAVVLDGEAGIAALLRRHDPPVVARVQDDGTVIDLRTVVAADDDTIVEAVLSARASLEATR